MTVSGASFEFATATRVVFGAGKLAELPAAARALGGRRALVVTGRSSARAEKVRAALAGQGVAAALFHVDGEPTVDVARAGVAALIGEGCDVVVGVGGGSALDAAKAIAALAPNGGDPLDYLEVIGRGQTLAHPSLPVIAIPTTAGTGSEVTRNAVLGSREKQVKASLRSPMMLPRVAIVDPDLLAGAPRGVIASSGVDALSQNIEPYISCRANPLTDGLAREGMQRSARSLRRAYLDGPDGDPQQGVREDLALASLMGGLCLANAGLGAVHGFAAPAGGMFAAPHGAVCAALIVASMDVNLRALQAREPGHPSTDRFREIAVFLTGKPGATAAAGIKWLADLCQALEIPGLGRYGMTAADVPALVAKAKVASSMRANPLPLTDEELTEIALRSI